MDYEKKYKEALEWVKKVMQGKVGFVLDDVLEKFPELRESEGEMIRKEIIAFLKYYHTGQGNMVVYNDDWVAWLEKQCSQIPANSAITCKDKQKPVDFSDLRTWKYIVDAVWTEKEGIGQYLDSPFTEEVAKKLQKRFGKIEQNPVEWHREDEQNLNACLGYIPDEFLRRWLMDVIHAKYDKPADKVEPKFKVGDKVISTISNIPYYITEVCNGHYITDVGCIIMFNAQDNFELVEQKPAWSEEDEETWNKAKQIFPESLNMQSGYVTGYKDAFKYFSLKKEWSEDDMKVIKEIIFLLKHHNSNESLTTVHSIEDMINWLKSLRPQNTWKPSDEQMDALRYVTNFDYGGHKATLVSLYEQLKKLRKE